MENQRLFLLMALGFISLLLYQSWMVDYGPKPEIAPQTEGVAGPAVDNSGQANIAASDDLPAVPTQTDTPSAVSSAPIDDSSAAVDTAGNKRISIDTDVVHAEIDTLGGSIVRLTLPTYPESVKDQETPFTLMSDEPDKFLIAQSGLQGPSGVETPTHKATFQAAADSYTMTDGAIKVPLVWESDGVRVTKTFTFTQGSYEIGLEYIIENSSDEAWPVSHYYQLQRKPVTKDETSQFIRTYTGAVISTEEEAYTKVDFGDIEDENLSVKTTGGWVAMIQHYFAGAWIPPETASNTFYTIHLRSQNRYIVGMNSDLQTVAPGTTTTLSSKAFIGPKVQDLLSAAAPKLELTVDFGFLTILAQPLFWLLKNIHAIVGNWGWAIIFLTCLIKLFFYPLSQAGYKSMARMKKLQPKLASLKERYGDDRAKMGQATMDLYKKEKVNPLGGCIPMLIQIPVFIALYWMLLESVELRQAPWMFWIKDLAIKDPFFVMPVIMGITMFIQQKLNPAPVDPIQAKVFMFLPLVFTVFFAFFPAGLVLYWIVNNTLSIAQQYYITKHVIGEK